MKPTASMIAAVKKVRPSERRKAAMVAERAYMRFISSPAMADLQGDDERREVAGDAAAAEVAYLFA